MHLFMWESSDIMTKNKKEKTLLLPTNWESVNCIKSRVTLKISYWGFKQIDFFKTIWVVFWKEKQTTKSH